MLCAHHCGKETTNEKCQKARFNGYTIDSPCERALCPQCLADRESYKPCPNSARPYNEVQKAALLKVVGDMTEGNEIPESERRRLEFALECGCRVDVFLDVARSLHIFDPTNAVFVALSVAAAR